MMPRICSPRWPPGSALPEAPRLVHQQTVNGGCRCGTSLRHSDDKVSILAPFLLLSCAYLFLSNVPLFLIPGPPRQLGGRGP